MSYVLITRYWTFAKEGPCDPEIGTVPKWGGVENSLKNSVYDYSSSPLLL